MTLLTIIICVFIVVFFFEYRKIKNAETQFTMTLNTISQHTPTIDANAEKKKLTFGDYSVSTSVLKNNTSVHAVNRYVAIDVETTGLYPSNSEIISIAAVKFHDLEPTEAMHTLVKPLKGIDPRASEVNGITLDDVVDKPTFDEIRESFVDFIGDYNIVAHNIMFDLKFLRHQGVDFDTHKRKYYDTLALSRMYDKSNNHKLYTACRYNNIYLGDNSHNAYADALACGMLFAKYVSQKVNGY